MSFFLTIVCVDSKDLFIPTEQLFVNAVDKKVGKSSDVFGNLIVEKTIQESHRAGFLGGLYRHLGKAIHGIAYYIYADSGDVYYDGESYMTSRGFFKRNNEDDKGYVLSIPDNQRESFEQLVYLFIAHSQVHKVLLLCELNNNITSSSYSDREFLLDPINTYCRLSIETFWELHDAEQIIEPAIVEFIE